MCKVFSYSRIDYFLIFGYQVNEVSVLKCTNTDDLEDSDFRFDFEFTFRELKRINLDKLSEYTY